MTAAPAPFPAAVAAWIDDLQPALGAVENCRVSLEGIAELLSAPHRNGAVNDLQALRSQLAALAAVLAEVLEVNCATIDGVLESMASCYDSPAGGMGYRLPAHP